MDKATIRKDVSWLGARLREPSTYAGVAAVAAVLLHNLDPGVIKDITMIGTGLGGVIAIAMPE